MKQFFKKNITIACCIFICMHSCNLHKQVKQTKPAEICSFNSLNIINPKIFNALDTIIKARKNNILCNEPNMGFSLFPYQNNDEYGYVVSSHTALNMIFPETIYGAFFYNDALFIIFDKFFYSSESDSIRTNIIANAFEKTDCDIIIVNCEHYSKYLPNDFTTHIILKNNDVYVTNCDCKKLIFFR